MHFMRTSVASLILIVAAVTVGACGSTSPTTTTVIKEVPAQPQGTTSSSDGAGSGRSDSNGESVVSDDGSGGETGSGKITVPNEVGKNHQAAQDDMQAHGLYNLSEEDATGQDRLLIIDRNWKVVSQAPAPGTKVSEDATVVLRSKKYTDP
jgi:hypothetical protein